MTLSLENPNYDIDMEFKLQMEDKKEIDDTFVELKYLEHQALLL
jgi:hypothetical protein